MSKGMYLICLEKQIRVWEYDGQDAQPVKMGDEFTTDPESVEEFWTWWRNSVGDESINVIPDICVLAGEAGLEFAIPVRTVDRTAWDEISIKVSLFCIYPAENLTLHIANGKGIDILAQSQYPKRELFLIVPQKISFLKDERMSHEYLDTKQPEAGETDAQVKYENSTQEKESVKDEKGGNTQRTQTQAVGPLKAFFVKEKQKSKLI